MSIVVTESAAEKIAELVDGNEDAIALRVGVMGGGCSGFNYSFTFAEEINDDDFVHRQGDIATVLIDPMSLMYLDNATIDYTKSLAGEQFSISNPNAQTTCGCGTSFSI